MPEGVNKNNKLKWLNNELKEQDFAVLLETGINMERTTPYINENFRVDRQNRMEKKEKNN